MFWFFIVMDFHQLLKFVIDDGKLENLFKIFQQILFHNRCDSVFLQIRVRLSELEGAGA